MICADTTTRFRLLDSWVGWDAQQDTSGELLDCNVSGLNDEFGLRLKDPYEPRITSDILTPWMPPPWIARGCHPCEWYLTYPSVEDAPAPPLACGSTVPRSVVAHLGPCCSDWKDVSDAFAGDTGFGKVVGVAVHRGHAALLHKPAPRRSAAITIRSTPTHRLVGSTELPSESEPLDLAFVSSHHLVVSMTAQDQGELLNRVREYGRKRGVEITEAEIVSRREPNKAEQQVLLAFDLAGQLQTIITVRADNPFERLAVARDGTLWAAAATDSADVFDLWRINRVRWSPAADARRGQSPCCDQPERYRAELVTDGQTDILKQLAESLSQTGLIAVSQQGFCLEDPATEGPGKKRCFLRDGTSATRDEALGIPKPPQNRLGQLLTQPLDSFIPRCRWHRVRVEAEIPDDTAVQIAVATSEVELPPEGSCQPTPTSWNDFPEGSPNALDWDEVPENVTDFLIDQPPGRYLYVRIRLQGTDTATPVIHRVRFDFPRVTSLNQLPGIYRENDEAEDFTERFLSLFDATTAEIDRALERLPALLDVEHVPEEVLPWLGTFLGIVFDSGWTTDQRRRLLRQAPQLYRQRGTRAGLIEAVKLVFGFVPAIDESVFRTYSGALNADAQVGATRLFGRSQSRFRVGRSALGEAPLRSYGNPDHDPVREGVHRFRIQVPPHPTLSRLGREHLNRLIETQKPAHTVHTLRVGGVGFMVGRSSAIGIDTQFVTPPPPVLRTSESRLPSGNLRLNGTSILRAGRSREPCGFRLGAAPRIGQQTVLK